MIGSGRPKKDVLSSGQRMNLRPELGLLAFALLAGCSAQGRDVTSSPSPASTSTTPTPTPSTSPTPVDAGISSNDSGSTPTNDEVSVVYGHSGTDLYRLDPTTKAVSHVGAFQGCAKGVIDIALDQASNMFGTTTEGLYRIDPNTAACTKIASGNYPNSLSFVPEGTVDANDEALVGYNDDVYVRIDTTSGQVTEIGNLGQGYVSSGDIVSVKNGGTYLTVKSKSGSACSDCLVEVDPGSGNMLKKLGSLGHKDVFGIAFWAGSIYGFDLSGQLFEVDLSNGSAVKTKAIGIPSAPSGLQFWGAGSTTSAPVTPVK